MIEFLYHANIQGEIDDIEKRFRTIRNGFAAFERLCQVQFDPLEPRRVIAPAKLHRITQNDIWTLWKVELVLPNSGLRPNQWPRIWFAVKGHIVAFLCISSHVDNYKDKKLEEVALSRLADIF